MAKVTEPKLKRSAKHHPQNQHIAELINKLKYFVEPDFAAGNDFWPRLDSRLNGQIHIIVQQAIEALDAAHSGKA